MKILFILNDWTIDPLGVGYLSSALKSQGHTTSIIKTEKEPVLDEIRRFKPNVLAYSVTTGMQKYYLQLNWKIKQFFPNLVSVWGGPHPTYFPEFIKDTAKICRGEGEEAFVDYLNRLETGEGSCLDTQNFSFNLRGIRIIHNPLRPLQDIDNIEFPDRELIYSYKENRNNPIKNVMTSRGCPYACPYCYNDAYKRLYQGQKTFRMRSIDSVIQEIKEIKERYPLELIWFEDDMFIWDKERLMKLLKRMITDVQTHYHCQVRVELLDEEIAWWLAQSGCKSVTFAIESGNDEIRQKVLNRKMTKKQILDSCKLLREHKIKYRIENMVGLPYETLENALETLKLNIKCKPTIGWCSLYQPYPKTKLGDKCIEEGLFDGDVDRIEKDFFTSAVLNSPKKEFNNLQKIFHIIVAFPWLYPFVKLLIRVRENRFYKYMYYWFKKYLYDQRLYALRK